MDYVTLSLNVSGKMPMYEQLYRYFVGEIRAGRLTAGEKLPSKRALGAHLRISRSTVETAYGMLVAEGYVAAKAKSGYYVAELVAFRDSVPSSAPCETPPPPPRSVCDFSTASVDTSLFPYSSWAKLNKEVVYSSPELLQRGDRQGDLALRQALASFLGEYRGVACSPLQIVVGAGMDYLTELLVQLLPENAVFGLEDPGYGAIRNTIRNNGRCLRFLPLDASGMDVSALERSDVTVAYTTPSHQFPMGLTMPAGRRSQLLRWASSAPDRYLIEDDYDSEFRHTSRPLPAMQGMDGAGRVIYIGTFSRGLAPSIRIAYLVLPGALLERYRALFSHSLSTVSRYEQAVMARFLSEGFYARYLRRAGNLYRRRCAVLAGALETLPGVTIGGSGGGMHFLVTVKGVAEETLCRRAAERGMPLRGLGSYCSECRPLPSTVVMGYGGIRDEQIPAAVEILREAWGV